MVLGANWRLAKAKSSMLHENNPDAAFMDEIRRNVGEKEPQTGAQVTSHQLSSLTS